MSDIVARAKASLIETCGDCDCEPCGWREMAFAEECRSLVPELIAEVERLRSLYVTVRETAERLRYDNREGA